MYNIKIAGKAQEEYCDEHEIPILAPASGNCPNCGRNIYMPIKSANGKFSGYSVPEAESCQITCCPHCHYSFCE